MILNGILGLCTAKRTIKIFAMVLTGVAIAFSTVVFQTITNNKILTPSIIGLDSLYMLIQTLVIFIFGFNAYHYMNKNINFFIISWAMIFFARLLYTSSFLKEKSAISTFYYLSESSSEHFSKVFLHLCKC